MRRNLLSNLIVWRSLKRIFATCLGTMVLLQLNVFLLNDVFLSYYCETECDLSMWKYPLPPEDRLIVSYLRHNVLDPPQKKVLEPLNRDDLDGHAWKGVGVWHIIQKVIRRDFVNLRNGLFIEVGASDGVFQSHTAWLEEEMGWSGLLIEPRKSAYQKLRRRRKAVGAQVCVADIAYNHREKFWQPRIEEDVPDFYKKITEGKSTLMHYVTKEDRELGSIELIPCYTLDALLLAAGVKKKSKIDFLVIETMGGENKILETLEDRDILMLLIRVKDGRSRRDFALNVGRLNMKIYEDIPEDIGEFFFLINNDLEFVRQQKPNE